MPLDLEKVARVTAQRYCRPTASYGVEDAAQVASLALHNQMPAWDPKRSAERTFAIAVAKRAILSENRAKRNRRAGVRARAVVAALPGDDWDVWRDAGAGMGDGPLLPTAGDWLWCLGEEDRSYAAADARETVAYIRQHCTAQQRQFIDAFLQGESYVNAAKRLGFSRERVRKVFSEIAARVPRETGYEKPVPKRYRGVSYNPKNGSTHPWRVSVVGRRHNWFVGVYRNQEAAARAYDKVAREKLGAEARLNFPEEQ